MSASKQGVARLAAGKVTRVNVAGVTAQYLAWIDAQADEQRAVDALLAAADTSNRPQAVLVAADRIYGELPEASGSAGHYGKAKVLILGSSNAQGYSASNHATTSWAARLASALSTTHEFVNPSVAGRSPTYWITPGGAAGRTPLEDLIRQHKPHIVIAAYATQNAPGQTTEAFLGYVEQTRAMCQAEGVRFIGVTPYISEDYDATKRDQCKRLAGAMKQRNIPSLNFAAVWGDGPLLPSSIDSGDGLHLNDAGHLEQFRQIPADMLSLTSDPSRSIRLPTTGGVTVPADAPTAFDLNAMPQGSWTIGFTMKLPTPDKWTTAPLYFQGGSLVGTRLRLPNANQIDVAGNIVHPVQTIASGSETHIALSYNPITGESRLWFNGARVSTVTGVTGQAATSACFGYRPDVAATANGYRFRNLTVHATVLNDTDVSRLVVGDVVPASIAYAASLSDGVARPAGAIFASMFGQATKLTSTVALP